MFLCREHELQMLNRRYQSNNCECIIIYGRRRVGKTALITEFAKEKKAILFPALKANAKDNLGALSKAIAAYKNPGITSLLPYSRCELSSLIRLLMVCSFPGLQP